MHIKKTDTQSILKPLVLSLLMIVARQYRETALIPDDENLVDKLTRYISEHYDTVTLNALSLQFSYHPNYLSTLLHKKNRKIFFRNYIGTKDR